MLPHPVIQQLRALKLDGMALALQEQQEQPGLRELSFEERLTLLVDRERACRDTRGLQRRLTAARLKVNASLEEVDVKHPRGLDARLLRSLAQGQWLAEKRGVIITGPTGVGKTFIGCALAHQACRQGFTALYAQTGRLLQELTLAKGDGRYLKLLASIARVNVLILDDWGLDVPTAEGRRILLEILVRVPQLRYQPICKSQRTSARLFEAGEFVRGPSTERGMRPDGVVVLAPGREDQACLIQALEPVQIQTLVPDTAVETLDVSVLDGLPRPDEGVRDATPMGPEIQALARELWAIVGGDRLRCPRKRTTASRARTTSCPVMEVPTCITRHSRVKSSTTFRTRNRCPEASWSDMKSRLHR